MPLDTLKQTDLATSATKNAVISKALEYKDIYTTVEDMVNTFLERVPYLIIAVIIFTIFWLLSRLFKFMVAKTLGQRAQHKQNLVLVLNRIGSTLIIFVGFLIAMVVAIPNFTPGQLISTLGIGSVAVGFAFKDTFQNLLSGILILLSEPFRIGDQIVTGSFEGTVEDIQIRATLIKTYDGRRIVIPNAQLFIQAVTVNTAFERRRVQVKIGIGASDDIEHAKQIIIDALHECTSVDTTQPITVVLSELGDYSSDLIVRWWIFNSAQVNVTTSTDEVLTAIKHKLTQQGIDLPYPTTQILFHDQTEETDGNRACQREGWPAKPEGEPNPRSRNELIQSNLQNQLRYNVPNELPKKHHPKLKDTARDPSEDSTPQKD